MYLAPLNYDRFFKKVFSNLFIAKNFLQDFLEVTIDEIERLPTKYKVTDDASVVDFDFRCKSDGEYFIVDMQQWYKSDVVKRFYLYDCLNSGLQLETLPKKEPIVIGKKIYENKIYEALLPTITLIWMSDDNLSFKDDYIPYALFPEQAIEFLRNEALWASKDMENIDIERKKVLTLLNNNTKNLSFLAKNRLIFAFQKNIVKNKKLKKYFVWFDFAEKTRNKNNTEEDFEAFKNNEVIMAVLERIQVNNLDQEERTAWEDADLVKAQLAFWKRDFIEETEANAKIKVEAAVEAAVEAKVEEKSRKTVISAHQKGLDADMIAAITDLPIEKVQTIINEFIKGV